MYARKNDRIQPPLFPLGHVVATPAALALLADNGCDPRPLLTRHAGGDWGDLSPEDEHANDSALDHGERLFSSDNLDHGKVWIITEADRSATTILLPNDYTVLRDTQTVPFD